MKKYLVLDAGGSALKFALMDHDGVIIEQGSKVIPDGANATFEEFRELVGGLYDQYKNQIEGIAMSIPGLIDSDKGFAHSGGALHYLINREIVKDLQERCPVNIAVENDGKCAALGELWLGGLKGVKDGLVLVLGTGIGGGIIIDGKLHKGKHFYAGEFSQITVTDFETFDEYYASYFCERGGVWGILTPLAKKKGIPKDQINGKIAFEMINSGDEEALEIFHKFCRQFAIQAFNLQNCFDPERIAVGGGISAQPILIEGLRKAVDEYADFIDRSSPYAEYIKPDIVRCELGNDANLAGALYSYITKFE